MKKIFSLLFITTIFSIAVNAQELVSNSGAYFSNSSGSLAWSVGEAVIATISDGTDTLTQGFHQSKFIFTDISESQLEGISVSVFPNPTTENISIEIESADLKGFSYTLLDQHGKLLRNKEITDKITEVDMLNHPAATYFVSVYKDGISVKTIQIIKNY
ncbi:MAG: T9SS type A sorting domain-containing protein [Bacteroidales bacterium]|nr:T9SS type A sorting domain-containing protein [Bacteroidales bacterium]